MKTKNIFEDAIENGIWINPYFAMYKYNIKLFSKLYKHTFTRKFKSVCKDVSHDCDKKDDKDIPAGGHDICNHLTRYDVTNTHDKKTKNWQRKQI
jgi:hypothetical protein